MSVAVYQVVAVAVIVVVFVAVVLKSRMGMSAVQCTVTGSAQCWSTKRVMTWTST